MEEVPPLAAARDVPFPLTLVASCGALLMIKLILTILLAAFNNNNDDDDDD